MNSQHQSDLPRESRDPRDMTSPAASSHPEPDASTVRRAVAASAIGNATEWFDYGVYAVSVVYITQNFFPGEAGTLLALSTFALSFLVALWADCSGARSVTGWDARRSLR